MQAVLNAVVKILGFSDQQVNSNPRLRHVDWLRDISGQQVQNPKSEAHQLAPGDSLTVFDGTRATTIDGTTTFSIALLPIEGASRYRITHTVGTAPGFRTGRNVASGGVVLTFAVVANGSLTVNAGAAIFGSVVAGDYVFIPNTTTGDGANTISVINSGYWQVLSKADNSNITLIRPAGQDFEGQSEVATPATNAQFRAFSAAGVQVGDSANISAGFAVASRSTFPVVAVTDAFVEILSTTALPAESGILPGAAGLTFYQAVKNFLYLESTQEIAVRLNGDSGSTQVVTPVDPSDPAKPGMYLKRGPAWSLVVVNRASVTADITVIHAE